MTEIILARITAVLGDGDRSYDDLRNWQDVPGVMGVEFPDDNTFCVLVDPDTPALDEVIKYMALQFSEKQIKSFTVREVVFTERRD